MTASLYIVSEVSARSPDMGEREFDEFVEDIRTNGQLVPIWIQGDEVIDGRKRLAACERLGITPKVVNLDPSQDVERVARALNVLRTHYSPSQRAIFAAERANVTPAMSRHVGTEKRKGNGHPNDSKFGIVPVTLKQAADEAGVSPSAVSKARQVMQDAAPEVVSAMKAGSLTIHAASQLVDAVPKKEQAAVVARVVEANKGKARQSPVGNIIAGMDPRKHHGQPKKPVEQFSRSVTMVDEGSRVLLTNAQFITDVAERDEWIATLTEARTRITRTLKTLEA